MKKLIIAAVIAAAAVIVFAIFFLVIPKLHADECRTRVYEDLKERADEVLPSVIGIVPKTEDAAGNISYGGGGSGIIFKCEGDTYYALTAAHVVRDPAAEYKVFTALTEYETVDEQVFEELGIEVPADGFYETLANAEVSYISTKTDLAIISFRSEDELKIAAFRETDIEKGGRIMCIGCPDGRTFTASFGEITSELKTVTFKDKGTDYTTTDSVLEHNAYINFGNSGGGAFDEDMKLAGLNTGGAFRLFGQFDCGYIIPCGQLRDFIKEWEDDR